jgi:hypothetical protein
LIATDSRRTTTTRRRPGHHQSRTGRRSSARLRKKKRQTAGPRRLMRKIIKPPLTAQPSTRQRRRIASGIRNANALRDASRSTAEPGSTCSLLSLAFGAFEPVDYYEDGTPGCPRRFTITLSLGACTNRSRPSLLDLYWLINSI